MDETGVPAGSAGASFWSPVMANLLHCIVVDGGTDEQRICAMPDHSHPSTRRRGDLDEHDRRLAEAAAAEDIEDSQRRYYETAQRLAAAGDARETQPRNA